MKPNNDPLALFQATTPGSWIAVTLLAALSFVLFLDFVPYVCGLFVVASLAATALTCGAALLAFLFLFVIGWFLLVRRRGRN